MTSTFHFLSTHFFLPKEKHQHLSSTTLSPIHHPTMLRKNAISTIRTNGHNLRRTDLLALLHQNLLKKKSCTRTFPCTCIHRIFLADTSAPYATTTRKKIIMLTLTLTLPTGRHAPAQPVLPRR
jgi:hypothetical protein